MLKKGPGKKRKSTLASSVANLPPVPSVGILTDEISLVDSSNHESQEPNHRLTLQEALNQRMEQEPFVALPSEQKAAYVEDLLHKQSIYLEKFQVLEKFVGEKQELFHEFLTIIDSELNDKACLEENVLTIVQQLNAKEYASELEKLSPEARVLNHSLIRALMDDLESGKTHFLSFVTQEVQLLRKENKLTKEAVTAQEQAVEQVWQHQLVQQMERLRNEAYKQGGALKGIVERVEEWNQKIPQSLMFEEMNARDRLHPYKENETKTDRELRERKVSGYPPRKKQIEKKAVALDLQQRAHNKKEKISKQHCELPDALRLEMQALGVRPVSNSRQGFTSMTVNYVCGTKLWKTDGFTQPMDNDRSFASTQKSTFPERKERNTEKLKPLIVRHLEIEKARQSKKATGEHGEYQEVVEKLARLRL